MFLPSPGSPNYMVSRIITIGHADGNDGVAGGGAGGVSRPARAWRWPGQAHGRGQPSG